MVHDELRHLTQIPYGMGIGLHMKQNFQSDEETFELLCCNENHLDMQEIDGPLRPLKNTTRLHGIGRL